MNRRPPQQPGENQNRSRRRRRPSSGKGNGQGGNAQPRPEVEVSKKAPPVLRRYKVVFYENHAQARDDQSRLAELKVDCDQLNIVIRAEGSMDDPELTAHGRVYAGEAWNLIHKRRQDDGWYNDMHE